MLTSSKVESQDLIKEEREPDRKAKREAQIAGYIAEVKQHFDTRYGENASKLGGWQVLYADCDIKPGTSITQCKKVSPITSFATAAVLGPIVVAAEDRVHSYLGFCAYQEARRVTVQVPS